MFDMQLNQSDMMDLDGNDDTVINGSRLTGAGASCMDLEESANNVYTSNYIPDILGNTQLERRLRHWLQSKDDSTSTTASVSQPAVKIALSLFRVQQNIYLLDFQRVEVCICIYLYVSIYIYSLL